MSFRNLRRHYNGQSGHSKMPVPWGPAIFLVVIVLSFIGPSLYKPWTMVLNNPQVLKFDHVELRSDSSVESTQGGQMTHLPDYWTYGSPQTYTTVYSFNFDRSSISAESLALLIPFARDSLVLRLNGKKYGAFAYPSGQDRWLWNKPMLFRFAEKALLQGNNQVGIEISSASAFRVAVSEVYLGPMEKLDTVFNMYRRLQVTLPFASFVLLIMSACVLLVYASAGGSEYSIAALFSFSAAVSLLNWVLVVLPIELGLWYVLVSAAQFVALTSMAFFVCIYFGLARYVRGIVLVFTLAIMTFVVSAAFASGLDASVQLLRSASVISLIGAFPLLVVIIRRYVASDNFDDRVMLVGAVLLIVYAIRDLIVHLGLVSPAIGLHIPMGYTIFTLSMAFVFLRSAVRRSRELEKFQQELSTRVENQADEIQTLTSRQKELELTAIAGRLSHIYSYEFRNPIGACLATGNLALKKIDAGPDALRVEAQNIVDSSMECSELLIQMFASEEVLPPVESSSTLRLPEWLKENADELSAILGRRLVVAESESLNVLAQPRVLLKAISLLLDGSYLSRHKQGQVTVKVSVVAQRSQLFFAFSKSLQPSSVGRPRCWIECYSSAQQLLGSVNSELKVFYDADGKMNAFVIDVPCEKENQEKLRQSSIDGI